ncbi:MAG: hypothetical protein GY754_16995 [bacterium]|nr:hypothetical protein [bacterium]
MKTTKLKNSVASVPSLCPLWLKTKTQKGYTQMFSHFHPFGMLSVQVYRLSAISLSFSDACVVALVDATKLSQEKDK